VTSRHLTPAEKAHELATWTHEIDDEGVGPLLAPLNAIDGVCTVQSCIGHVKRTSEVERYVENGCIEMRLDEKRTQLFYEAMPVVAAIRGVDDVLIHWRVSTEQRCTVWFQPGNIAPVVGALVAALSKGDAGARLDPNPGVTEERCA
jgi:hypothetical protein